MSGSGSSYNNRVEPNFFNVSNNVQKKQNETPNVDENAYWSSLPPPYTPTVSEPSAPPLDAEYTHEQQHYSPPPSQQYPPQQYTAQQPQVYPPQGYNQNPQYGSTNNAPAGWPWRPPQASEEPQLPPGIPPYEVASVERPRNKSRFHGCFCFTLFILIFLTLSGIFGDDGGNLCLNTVRWEGLPTKFDFDTSGLIFRVSGGQLSSGKVKFKQDSQKAGMMELNLAVSPPELIQDPELGYTLGRTQEGITNLEIRLPSVSNSCMKLDAVVYLPETLDFLQLEAKNVVYETESTTLNVSHLVMQSSNNDIKLHSKWHGKTLLLETTNARIEVSQPIESDDKVILSTKNGNIEIADVIKAKNTIAISTRNAAIDANKLLETAVLTCSTSNGPVNLNQIKAEKSHVKASNGYVKVNHGEIEEMIDVQTSNGKLDVGLDSCAYCSVIATTTNANLHLAMPGNHEGPFDASTSSSNSIQFIDKLNWSNIRRVDKSRITGDRYLSGNNNHKGGLVQAITSNGNAIISFG